MDPITTCKANQTVACTCQGGDEGVQTCIDNGSRYGVCICDSSECAPLSDSPCTCEGGEEGTQKCLTDGSGYDACHCESASECTPNQAKPCTCENEDEGTQKCLADGSGYDACHCEPASECTPDESKSCTCENEDEGTQKCLADGSGYDACHCESAPACTPDESKSCTCENEDEGTQKCEANGSGFGACHCDPTTICTPNAAESCACPHDVFGTKLCAADGMDWGSCTCPIPVCTPDATQTCSCGGNVEGTQTCAASGLSWSECAVCACPEGQAVLNGQCVDAVDEDCDTGYTNASGRCALRFCAVGYNNDGTGQCLPEGECANGYEATGGTAFSGCRHAAPCTGKSVNNGLGICVSKGCAPNFARWCDPHDFVCTLFYGPDACTHQINCVGGTIVADAGVNVNTKVGQTVTLDGSGSIVGNGPIFEWSQIDPFPPTDAPNPVTDDYLLTGAKFTADTAGTYRLRLRVTGGQKCMSQDSIVVTVTN